MLAAITPFYLPASPAGVARYFAELDKTVGADAELYAYLFRVLTGYAVAPEDLADLAGLRSVVGAKISGESTARVAEYIAAAPLGFAIYSGNDVEFANVVQAGGAGTASGVSAVFPERFVALGAALRSGDAAEIAEAHTGVVAAVAAVGGIVQVKAGVGLRGLPAGPMRVALDPGTPEQLQALGAEIAATLG
jgi:4-hydroxy-tetrahydrodipicolinate synthase